MPRGLRFVTSVAAQLMEANAFTATTVSEQVLARLVDLFDAETNLFTRVTNASLNYVTIATPARVTIVPSSRDRLAPSACACRETQVLAATFEKLRTLILRLLGL